MSPLGRILASGLAAGAASALAAMLASRSRKPLNAVAHIYDGGPPPSGDGPGHRNTAIGTALHFGASVWWAAFFELFRARTGRPVASAAATSALAYLVDYHVVGKRFQPGFEKHLTGPQLFGVYASLAAGFALPALLRRASLRRLRHHQPEDHQERAERGPAKRRPRRVKAPELRR